MALVVLRQLMLDGTLPDKVRPHWDAQLRAHLALDDLGLCHLRDDWARAVAVQPPPLTLLDACHTLGQLSLSLAESLAVPGAEAVRLLAAAKMPGKGSDWGAGLKTVWWGEMIKGEALGGFVKDDKVFARFRRTYRQEGEGWARWWGSLSAPQRRRHLLEACPWLPLSHDDPLLPVSLKLLPSWHVDALAGTPQVRSPTEGGETCLRGV